MDKSINKKQRVLFLGVGLYNYDKIIYQELSRRYEVSYVCLYPLKKEHKFLYSLLSHFFSGKVDSTNSKMIFEKLKDFRDNSFDYIFTIKGSKLNQSHFDYLDEHYPKARKILYLWDAWSLIENKEVLLRNFQEIFTFDSEDSKKYGFTLRPLFYTKCSNQNVAKNIDISFIGTEHSNRLENLRRIKTLCKSEKLTYFFRLMTTNVPIIKAHLNIAPYNRSDLDILVRKPLSYDEVMSFSDRSRCVVDFSHPAQCGLTMRTIETIANGCKLITTNRYINEYRDLPENSFLVIDESTTDECIINFLVKPVTAFNISKRYTLESFINELIS